ncbi:hypothetical protein EXIGLDRAFT_274387 [Exidia glandulosa HHB12029]|uniref:Cupredoxin n=1 Tax=Exidia glandulosa HHB12029 TaxID=1314781 RepID=A0A165M7B4_EXIGL|nr:hypothetical protein EXIGLDRAFT_274387 [Exidia glandulosa HHB12029]
MDPFDPTPSQRPALHGVSGDTFDLVISHSNYHSIVEVSLDDPCTPLQGGFDTGTGPVNMTVVLTSDEPIYFTCGHPGHCHAGEVGAINASPESMVHFTQEVKDGRPLHDTEAWSGSPHSSVGSGVGAVVVSVSSPPQPAETSGTAPTLVQQRAYPLWAIPVAVVVAAILLASAYGARLFLRRRRVPQDLPPETKAARESIVDALSLQRWDSEKTLYAQA